MMTLANFGIWGVGGRPINRQAARGIAYRPRRSKLSLDTSIQAKNKSKCKAFTREDQISLLRELCNGECTKNREAFARRLKEMEAEDEIRIRWQNALKPVARR